MYANFTGRARKVMQQAEEEAQRLNYEYIGTEHILLGLVRQDGGVAATLLKHMDIDLHRIQAEIERFAPSFPHMVPVAKLPQTPRVENVIQYANDEARNCNQNNVSTEHLLLGLLREEQGVAAQVLMNMGITLDDVRGALGNLLERDTNFGKTSKRATEPGPVEDQLAELPDMPLQAFLTVVELDARIDQLNREKQAAVAELDFEKAALLRDQKDKLNKEMAAIIQRWRTDPEG